MSDDDDEQLSEPENFEPDESVQSFGAHAKCVYSCDVHAYLVRLELDCIWRFGSDNYTVEYRYWSSYTSPKRLYRLCF